MPKTNECVCVCEIVRDKEKERENLKKMKENLKIERRVYIYIYREGNLTIQNTNTCLQRNSDSAPACAVGCSIGKHHQISMVF